MDIKSSARRVQARGLGGSCNLLMLALPVLD